MVTNSTAGLEAIALDKPVIVINFCNVPENVPYVKSGAALQATNIDELKEAVSAISGNIKTLQQLAEGRKRFVDLYLYKNDGKASKRIVEVIEKLCCY
jgi:glycosyltransferase involved in cell wall biosynthesis